MKFQRKGVGGGVAGVQELQNIVLVIVLVLVLDGSVGAKAIAGPTSFTPPLKPDGSYRGTVSDRARERPNDHEHD
jgi:hypothetical protein